MIDNRIKIKKLSHLCARKRKNNAKRHLFKRNSRSRPKLLTKILYQLIFVLSYVFKLGARRKKSFHTHISFQFFFCFLFLYYNLRLGTLSGREFIIILCYKFIVIKISSRFRKLGWSSFFLLLVFRLYSCRLCA